MSCPHPASSVTGSQLCPALGVSFRTPATARAPTVSAQTRQLDFHIPPVIITRTERKSSSFFFFFSLQAPEARRKRKAHALAQRPSCHPRSKGICYLREHEVSQQRRPPMGRRSQNPGGREKHPPVDSRCRMPSAACLCCAAVPAPAGSRSSVGGGNGG